MSTVDASTRGRRNRANGAATERRVAAYLRGWYPDATRAVRNTHPDPGDIDGTDATLWWSVKDCAVERYGPWLAELQAKAGGRFGVLVVRRRGYADPGTWWAWLSIADLTGLLCAYVPGDPTTTRHVRLELRALLDLLAHRHLTPGDPS